MDELIKLLADKLDNPAHCNPVMAWDGEYGYMVADSMVIKWKYIKQILQDYFKDKVIVKHLCDTCEYKSYHSSFCCQFDNNSKEIVYECSGHKEVNNG
jgi:hypothetical protein